MRSRLVRLPLLAALFLLMGLLVAPPVADAKGTLRITRGPRVVQENPKAGDQLTFEVSASFPGEEWIAFNWDFGDGEGGTGFPISGQSVSQTVSHTFTKPGVYKVICTAWHGWKSGQFGVGPYKFRRSKAVKVTVLPSLPMTIGALTIDADEIKALDKKSERLRIFGNVTINGLFTVGNDIIIDTKKNTATLSGNLKLPGAGDYANGLDFVSNVTVNATTGEFVSVDLPKVKAKFEVAGFSAELKKVSIVGAGLEIDFEIKIPRLTQDPTDPETPPVPDAPLDLSKVYPPAPTPQQLAALSFQKFRIDRVSPYLHPLGETKATINNVPLGFAGTKFGIDTLEAGIDPSQKRYFGTLKLKLPTDRGIGGTFQIREGRWDRVGFSLRGKLPFWTFTGGLEAIYITSLDATVVNLAKLEGMPEQTPEVHAGAFDPISGTVTAPGVVFEWGPITNVAGESVLTPIRLQGACIFDPFWNVRCAGQLSFFEDVFGPRMRILGAQGFYKVPAPGKDGGTWYMRGDMVFDNLFTITVDCTTSFSTGDFHVVARGSGSTLIPQDHWIGAIIPNMDGTLEWEWRKNAFERNVISFHGRVDVPTTYPVLRNITKDKGVAFRYDLIRDEWSAQFTDVFTVVTPGKAVSREGQVTGGGGAEGLIVRLTHEGGTVPFNLRLPDGSLLTPGDDDDTSVDYFSFAGESFYALANAADGTYTAEFDDAGLGTYEVEFFAPRAVPTVAVDAVTTDESLSRYETLSVPLTTTGLAGDATVRLYLDEDGAWGGGEPVATGVLSDGALDADLSGVPAGDYSVIAQVTGADDIPILGTSFGRLTVRDHVALVVAKGKLIDSPKVGKDKFLAKGALAFDGPSPDALFDPLNEELRLTLGSDGDPFEIRVPAGDLGWKVNGKGVMKWKSAKGVLPKVKLLLHPGKPGKDGKFTISVAGFDLTSPPANPIRVHLRMGEDESTDTSEWTELKAGKLKR